MERRGTVYCRVFWSQSLSSEGTPIASRSVSRSQTPSESLLSPQTRRRVVGGDGWEDPCPDRVSPRTHRERLIPELTHGRLILRNQVHCNPSRHPPRGRAVRVVGDTCGSERGTGPGRGHPSWLSKRTDPSVRVFLPTSLGTDMGLWTGGRRTRPGLGGVGRDLEV